MSTPPCPALLSQVARGSVCVPVPAELPEDADDPPEEAEGEERVACSGSSGSEGEGGAADAESAAERRQRKLARLAALGHHRTPAADKAAAAEAAARAEIQPQEGDMIGTAPQLPAWVEDGAPTEVVVPMPLLPPGGALSDGGAAAPHVSGPALRRRTTSVQEET